MEESKAKEDVIVETIDAEWLADVVGQGIYNTGKAKLFNILESQFEGQKLEAMKHLVKDVIVELSKNARETIIDILEEWESKIEIDLDAIEDGEGLAADYQEYEEAVR